MSWKCQRHERNIKQRQNKGSGSKRYDWREICRGNITEVYNTVGMQMYSDNISRVDLDSLLGGWGGMAR
jgi:hypothetical protein